MHRFLSQPNNDYKQAQGLQIPNQIEPKENKWMVVHFQRPSAILTDFTWESTESALMGALVAWSE